MKNKRASLTIEELRSHAKLIQDGSFDAADLAGGKDNDSATTDPVMEALLVVESSTFMDGTRGNNNNHCNMLMTSYSVLTNEAVEQRHRLAKKWHLDIHHISTIEQRADATRRGDSDVPTP
jgi:hypothetical protein